MDTYVKGNYSISATNVDVYAKGNLTEKVDGNRKTTVTGTETLEITGAVDQKYKAMLTTKITGAASIKSDVAMVVGGSTISFN